MIIHYVKSKQGGGKQATAAVAADSTAAAKGPAVADSAKKASADTTVKK
jgi:hypothetical protein